ncbi:MAG: transglycosylase domain-containing protein [Alloprevotella sp.]
MRKKFVIYMWAAFLLAVLLVGIGFVGIEKGWFCRMPELEELQNPISKYASQIITSDGKVLATCWTAEGKENSKNRVYVGYDSISPNVFHALVATEDVRFYDHSGIDGRAFVRAIVKRGMFGRASAGGGSTITQQLAKQLYTTERAENTLQRLMQKPIEWVIAVKLERIYTKQEIMTLYLNHFDFLHNAVGIRAAAKVYFGKHPRDLSVNEAALLVGMCKNPSYFNPIREPERCRNRRNIVLEQMVKAGYLTDAEASVLRQEPLKLDFHRMDYTDASGSYLTAFLKRTMMARQPQRKNYMAWEQDQFQVDSLAWETDPLYGWCNKNTKRDGSHYNIYTDGLKIYTTIDSRMQRYAEESVAAHVAHFLQGQFEKEGRGSKNFPYSAALSYEEGRRKLRAAVRRTERWNTMKADGASEDEIWEAFRQPRQMSVFTYHGEVDTTMSPIDSLKYYKAFLRSSLFSIEPQTGHVKAYVGGLNFSHFQYDMATRGRRQVGSTIKPFVYTMALESGFRPSDIIVNQQRTYHVGNQSWTPRNGSRSRYGQPVTLRWGLSQSNNWITAELMYQVSPDGRLLVDYLKRFGITSPDMFPSLSLCLGPCGITAAEMASAYTAFVNKGLRCSPIFVTRIEDGQGNIIAEFQPRINEVITEQTSYDMIDMLRAVIDSGTGGRLRYKFDLTGPIAGKTGTTNGNSDGWFVGIVPRLITACWVGGDEPDIHFNSMAMGQGASSALPIWAYYMKKIYRDNTLGYRQDEAFATPPATISDPAAAGGTEESFGGTEEVVESEPAAETDLFE